MLTKPDAHPVEIGFLVEPVGVAHAALSWLRSDRAGNYLTMSFQAKGMRENESKTSQILSINNFTIAEKWLMAS